MTNKKPKILFIGPTPPPYSGPELSMQQFLESEALNNEFYILFLKTNFRTDNTNKGKFGIAMLINFFKFFFKLIKLLILERPKCVYYPITPTQVGWIGRDSWTILLSKLFGAKVIIHLRGSHFKLNFSRFNFLIKKLTAFSLRKVDKAIVQASYLKNQFSPFIPESKVAVLYQAMDVEEFKLSNPQQIQKGKILVVGHMTKAKGYTDILKIIPAICEKFPYITFYFAGNIRAGERGVFFNQFTGEKIDYEDPFKAEEILLNSKFKNNYKNIGIISGTEKMAHFSSCEFYLTASYSEGFSRSLLESMAVGKPLVYTPVGAHKEVLENEKHGYSFVPGNLAELETALIRMIDYPDKIKMGEFNRNYTIQNFSIDKIVTDFKTIINNTVHCEENN